MLAALEDRGVLVERWSLGEAQEGNGTVAANAAELNAHIVDYLKPLKADKVHVIAHSKGGLDTQGLQAGDSLVEANLASDKFQTIDGPYQAISLVVVQGANSARLTNMGSTDSYSRRQFYPKKVGDLGGDGVVGPADVNVITQQRGPALKPGDRRDINRDGVIDLRDARALQQLR